MIISFYGKIYSLSKFIINPILVAGYIDGNFPIAIHHPIPRPKPNTHITPAYLITVLDHNYVLQRADQVHPRDYENSIENPGYTCY